MGTATCVYVCVCVTTLKGRLGKCNYGDGDGGSRSRRRAAHRIKPTFFNFIFMQDFHPHHPQLPGNQSSFTFKELWEWLPKTEYQAPPSIMYSFI